MKKVALAVVLVWLFLMGLCAIVQASDLQWDYPTDWAIIDGYIVYFNEHGQADTPYNKTVLKANLTQDGVSVTYANFEPALHLPINLPADQTWDIWITAYNASGQSGPSNIVQYMIFGVPPFVPPPDVLPVWETTPIPGTPYGISRRVN